MLKEPTIRRITKADIPACAELMRYSWYEHTKASSLMNRQRLMRINGAESWAERMIADESYIVLVAEFDSEIVGFLSSQVSDAPGYLKAAKQLYIIDIVVSKSAQRRGIATSLENAIEAEAKKAGAGIILSDIYPYNDASRQLFGKQGHELAYEVWYKYLG